MAKLNLEKIGATTVWNYHNINLETVGYRKGSNLNEELKEIKKKGIKGMVTVYVEAIGRTGHSASRVGVYKGVTDSENFLMYYSPRHAEYQLELV